MAKVMMVMITFDSDGDGDGDDGGDGGDNDDDGNNCYLDASLPLMLTKTPVQIAMIEPMTQTRATLANQRKAKIEVNLFSY